MTLLAGIFLAATPAIAQERWEMPQDIYRAIEDAGQSPDLDTLRSLLARVDAEASRCERIEPDPVACEEAFNLAAAMAGEAFAEPASVAARYQRAIAVAERKYGASHETPWQLHRTFAQHLMRIGQAQAAEDRMRLVLERAEGMGLQGMLVARGDLAALMTGLGRFDEAEAYLSPALDALAEGEWRMNPVAISLKSTEAALAAARGRHAKAAELYSDTCIAMYRTFGDSWGVAACSLAWGMSLVETGDLERAGQVLKIAANAHDKLLGPTHPQTLLARAQAARALTLQGKAGAAERLFARNRAQLANDPQSVPAELRTLLWRLDAEPLVASRRSLALARTMLMEAQRSALEALAGLDRADALARRSLDSARPAFLLRVRASWLLGESG